MPDAISFFKMSGSGNDFIVIDNREPLSVEPTEKWIQKMCARKQSVGADGVIFIESSDSADFKWRFHNSDGSLAEMCGNGARCAARFAYVHRIAGTQMSFQTDAGLIRAEILGERVRIKMSDPGEVTRDERLDLNQGQLTVHSVNTGVPHAVIFQDNLDAAPVLALGKEIRYHNRFAPAGTNVNFVNIAGQRLHIRTYERGVEDETLACGTGSVAGAIVASLTRGLRSPIHITPRGGGELTVQYQTDGQRFWDVYLEGDARIIYRATLEKDAWNW